MRFVRKPGSAVLMAAIALSLLAAPAGAKKTTITFAHWYNFNKPATDYVNKVVKLYQQANPNVVVKQVVTGWGQGYMDKILTMSIAGMTPDVIMVSGIFLTSLSGVLTELDPLVAASKFDETISYASMWRGCTWKGKTLGVPLGGGVQRANFYNIDLFLKAGLNANRPPLTWDDFMADAKKLTVDSNGDGKPDLYGTDNSVGFYQMMNVAAGGDYTTSNGLAVDWNSPAGLKAWEWAAALYNNKVFGGAFFTQKAAMYMIGPWEMSNVQKSAKFKWGITRYPTLSEKDVKLYGSVDALGLGKVPQDRRKVAWDFVRFIMSPDMQAMLTIDTGFPSMNSKALLTPAYKKALEQMPQLAAGNEMMKYSYAPLPTPKDGEVNDISNKYLWKVMGGTMDWKKAAGDAQREATALLARFAKRK